MYQRIENVLASEFYNHLQLRPYLHYLRLGLLQIMQPILLHYVAQLYEHRFHKSFMPPRQNHSSSSGWLLWWFSNVSPWLDWTTQPLQLWLEWATREILVWHVDCRSEVTVTLWLRHIDPLAHLTDEKQHLACKCFTIPWNCLQLLRLQDQICV